MKLLLLGLLLGLASLSLDAAPAFELSAERLMSWLQQGKPLMLLDVRGRQAYAEGTIDGAIDGGMDPAGFLPGRNRDEIVLIVPERAEPAFVRAWVVRLQDAHQQVWVLFGGLSEWIARGGRLIQPQTFYTKPGTVPFLIPKGLCEGSEPAQVFQ